MEQPVKNWLERDPDPNTRKELERLVQDNCQSEIEQRFKNRLEFGTAGLRGILGAGPNRMNRLVIRESSAGLGAYLLETVPDACQRGVVIAYDARHMSYEFALDTACVLAGLGFRVFLFEDKAPTPLGAFAVRDLNATAGVVVTASHNPPEYNGYKVYWGNGAQIIPPHDLGIAKKINLAQTLPIPFLDFDKAKNSRLVCFLGQEIISKYLRGIKKLSVRPYTSVRKKLPIAYTPLHGVGAKFAEAALKEAGFENVHAVKEQRDPDGDFPTLRFPNPEEPHVMDRVIALARSVNAEIACANDPDADRLAVALRFPNGDYRQLNGDQIGVLLGGEFIDTAPQNASVVSTIVSSRLLGIMARAHHLEYVETLTGFKWITNAGLKTEQNKKQFVFGYEEALGYTIGGLVRDKDGISAVVAFAELTAHMASQGKTVLDRLTEIYRTYGFFLTSQRNIALDKERTRTPIGELLRQKTPQTIAGFHIRSVTDVLNGCSVSSDGCTARIDLPPSDVLVYHLDNDARVIVRPSGTEPKIKCYYEIHETILQNESYVQAEQRAEKGIQLLANNHQSELAQLMNSSTL